MAIMNLTTYQTGILHARVYRNVREHMETELEDYSYSMMQWALLGLVFDYTSEGGVRGSQLAGLLNVESSLVTNMLNILEAKGLIERVKDSSDARASRIVTTRKGENDVKRIEKSLSVSMRNWFAGIDLKQTESYIRTLQKLATK